MAIAFSGVSATSDLADLDYLRAGRRLPLAEPQTSSPEAKLRIFLPPTSPSHGGPAIRVKSRVFGYRKGVSDLSVLGPFVQISRLCRDAPARSGRAERYWSREARRTLLASLTAKPPVPGQASLVSLVAQCDQDELVSLALAEGVAGPASQNLGALLAPEHHSRLLTAARQQSVRHLGHLAWLQRFGAALEAADVPWVVLKGPVLAEISYGAVTRGYADLDLMVPARQLRRAIDALQDAGAVVADQDWGYLLEIAKGELTMAVHGSPLIDLHWHLIYLRSARQRFMICTDDLLERRRKMELRGVDAWALEPTDFAIHIALHASSQGAHRLRRLLDIERTLANQAPDWDALVRRCRAWRVALPVGVLLNASKETLGAEVPDEVVQELAGRPLERLLAHQLTGWAPSGRLPGGRSVKTGLSRSLRDSLFATSVQFGSESWRVLGSVVKTKPMVKTEPTKGPDAGDSRHPGDLPGYERFLEMVERVRPLRPLEQP